MTAIYGFTDQMNRRCALAADDREGNSGQRVDKIHNLFSRFTIAVVGVSVSDEAIGVVGYFDGLAGHQPPQTVQELSDGILQALRVVVRHLGPLYESAVERGELSETDWNAVKMERAEIIVLDRQENQLYDIDFGLPFGTEGLAGTPSMSRLADRQLHCFALAKNSPVFRGQAPAVDQPLIPYFERLLAADQQFDRRIGGLGAYFISNQGMIEVGSAFSGPVDFAEARYSRGFVGYQITVICGSCSAES